MSITKRDIAVEWELSALCSVCPDGIGTMETIDADTIECQECGSWWDMEGAYQGTEPKE